MRVWEKNHSGGIIRKSQKGREAVIQRKRSGKKNRKSFQKRHGKKRSRRSGEVK